MKKILFIPIALTLVACSHNTQTIEVSNPLGFDRNGELVAATVDLSENHILKDVQGNEVAYQVVDGQILFQANVPADSMAVYTWSVGQPSPVEPLTTAFFLGDRRKDDFCWENDKAAYRMYGPALLPENPSSGVDLWLKHSSQLTADAMYKQEENGKPYHVDYGLGIDSYKVGHAAGCGGIAIVSSGQLWPGGPFSRYEILQEGPLQTIFRLSYDSVQVGNSVLTEELTITINAGANLNKAEVILRGDAIDDLMVGGGIFLHDSIDNLQIMPNSKAITYAEKATSDKGIYKIHEQQGIDVSQLDFGRNYCAIIVPGAEDFERFGDTQIATRSYHIGNRLTYYFGGAWSKRDYKTDDDWMAAILNDAICLDEPLQVIVR